MLIFDEDMTPDEWALQEERDAVETAEYHEHQHRFAEAQEYLDNAAAADDHSSDVDPGRGRW